MRPGSLCKKPIGSGLGPASTAGDVITTIDDSRNTQHTPNVGDNGAVSRRSDAALL
jgi:hypothetical protein